MPLGTSFILLGEQSEPSEAAIRDFLAVSWPDLSPATNFSKDESTLSFTIGSAEVALGMMPAPIPWPDLAETCATSMLWPDAEETVKAHKAHIVVTAFGELTPIELSICLTQVTAAVMHATPTALGVQWWNAMQLVPKALFNQFALEVLPKGPPIHIWVGLRAGPDESGRTSGFTTGLAALGHMEFETKNSPTSPSELRELFFTLCDYIIANGPVILDGNTVGGKADEKIRVVYSDSSFGRKDQVMRLDYETVQPKKSKWKFWA